MMRDLSDLEHLFTAAETLREIQSRRPAIARFEVETALKANGRTAVFEGRYDGAHAVLKLFQGAGRAEHARAQKRELTRLAATMDTGPWRVAPILAAWPGEGITVTAHVTGTRLDRAIAQAGDSPMRDMLFGEAGQWLAHLVAPANRVVEFAASHWSQARHRELARIADRPDARRARALMACLDTFAPTVAGKPVTQARCHGDFAPINLIRTPHALYGVDIQNAHWLPLVKDVARFLVFVQTTHPRPGGTRRYGIDARDLDALLAPLTLLDPHEQALHLPFFIGVELAAKLAHTDRTAPKADNLRSAIDGFLKVAGKPAR
ncbi:MAG: hypothetical protein JXJ18_06350 [Rhodobacteraceae bacterium]|nr:hypothetical protein [Paracoccaceae bacterium]